MVFVETCLGVRELWTVRSSWYRLPFFIRWHDVRGEITLGAGIPLLRCQLERLEYIFQGKLITINGNRFIDKPNLITMADHVQDDLDPETLVEWSPHMRDIDGEIETKEMTDFIGDVVKAGWFATHAEALKVWRVFLSVALRRLLHDHKSVDMGFVTLRAVPLRRCWQASALKAVIDKKMGMMELTPELAHLIGHQTRWSFVINNSVESFFAWNIDAVTDKRWRRKVLTREVKHRKEVGGNEYVDQVGRWMEENAERMRQALVAFMDEGCKAQVGFSTSGHCGRPRFGSAVDRQIKVVVPKGWDPNRFDTIWKRGVPHLVVVGAEHGEPSRIPYSSRPVARVQSLSNFRQVAQDVRDTGLDVRGTNKGGRPKKTVGVPVLHADQVGDGNKLLAV